MGTRRRPGGEQAVNQARVQASGLEHLPQLAQQPQRDQHADADPARTFGFERSDLGEGQQRPEVPDGRRSRTQPDQREQQRVGQQAE